MRRPLAATVFVLALVSTHAAAQTARPIRVAGHFTGTMFDGPFDNLLVGGRVLIPFTDRLDVYPSVSRFVDGVTNGWEVSIALQWRPFGSPDRTPFYLAMGWLGMNDGNSGDGFDLWAPGVEIPSGRLRPYAELQFLGPLRHVANPQAGFGVQAQFGMTWALR
jgi:hypothetical protein